MLATITWTNELVNKAFGDTHPGDPNDNHFDDAFDVVTNGVVDRTYEFDAYNVVDAAIQDWKRVINSFNYTTPGTVFNVTISMAATGTSGTSSANLGAGTPSGSIVYTDGKPSSAVITIGWLANKVSGTNTMSGWYLDTTPNDLSTFTAVSNSGANRTDAFFGLTSPTSNKGAMILDLFSTVEHELGHAMGLYDSPKLKAVATDTGVQDAQNVTTSPPTDYWRIDTANVHALWTASDNFSNDNGPVHFAEAGAVVTQNGRTYYGANGLMNSRDSYYGRKLIDDSMALILQDVYGYSVTLPSTFGTFYDGLDPNSDLHIQTPGGNNQVTLAIVGSNLQVTIVLGSPVPGIDPSTIVSQFALGAVKSIDIKTGTGADQVTLPLLGSSVPITVDEGGSGGDTLHILGTTGVDHVQMGFSSITSTNLNVSHYTGVNTIDFTNGFDANDTLTFDNRADVTDQTWEIRYDRLFLLGGVLSVMTSPFGAITCLGGSGVDHVYFEGNRNPGQSVDVDTGDGNDVITVGYANPFIALYAPLTISAGAGNDTIAWYQVVNSYNDISGNVTYPISVDGGSGYNAMSINETSQNLSGEAEFYDVYDSRIVMSDSTSGTNADFTYDNMQAMSLQCSPNGGSVKVHSTSSDLDPGNQFSILGTPGMNTFLVYPHDASGNLTINGNLAITGSSSTSDNVTIDDTTSFLPITYTFANTFGPGTTNINGLGARGMGIASNVENITVKGSGGGNTFNVNSFKSGSALHLLGGGGADTLNFGVSNILSEITSIGSFSFDGQGGSDVFNINNTGSTSPFTYTQGSGNIKVDNQAGTVYSLGAANVEKLQFNAGSGGDSFYVDVVPSGTQTVINGNAGLDGLVLGNATSNLDAIQGLVYYNTGADAGNMDAFDTADTTGDIVHLTTSSLGVGPGDTLFGVGGGLYFDNLVNFGVYPGITLSLGSGADAVLAEPLPVARVTVNGNSPTSSPGDTLRISLATATSPVFTSNGTGAGTYTFANAAALNYTGFESAVAAIPGDFDLSGTVNQSDYTQWKAVYGAQVAPGTGGDFNGNGIVDAADYTVWRANLGKHSPGAGVGASATEAAPLAALVEATAQQEINTPASYEMPQIAGQVFSISASANRRSDNSVLSALASTEQLQQNDWRAVYFDRLNSEFRPSDRPVVEALEVAKLSSMRRRESSSEKEGSDSTRATDAVEDVLAVALRELYPG